MYHVLLTVCLTISAGPQADAAAELAARIDRHIEAGWAATGAVPVEEADDAEFLRRATLDLTGLIPAAGDVREFLADTTDDKRQRLIERLGESAAFARHQSAVWTADWVPQASEPVAERFRLWLEETLRARTTYDQVVKTLLTAPAHPLAGENQTLGSAGFLVANDFKAENLAANSARQFFGLNLDCAQCHNHPFARWTQAQFWEFAAFFADVQAPAGKGMARIAIPQTDMTVSARFPDGAAPQENAEVDPRVQLVAWMADRQTPYFARNAVNRLCAYVWGSGLVEPLDDLSGAVAPSHPALLDELAAAYVDSGYDVRFLLKALMLSRPYQLTSASREGKPATPQSFARMPLRPLSAEQLLDSYLLATGLPAPTAAERNAFLGRFRLTDRRAEPEASVLQTLMRMNGPLSEAATAAERGPTLVAVTNAPLGTIAERIEVVYLTVLGRPPATAEAVGMAAHVQSASSLGQGLSDVMWVLLNSAEFGLNH